jgi:hypothetical protein
MPELVTVLDRVYVGRDGLTRDELYRGAMSADASLELVTDLYLLPEGSYRRSQVAAALQVADPFTDSTDVISPQRYGLGARCRTVAAAGSTLGPGWPTPATTANHLL